MPVEYFLRYEGKCYDVGTKVRVRRVCGEIIIATIIKFFHNSFLVIDENGCEFMISQYVSPFSSDKIIGIVKPVYYTDPVPGGGNNRNCPSEWDIEIGWVWYIIIMIVGTLFNTRWMIYILATAFFFLWKNGFMNGGTK